MKRTKSALEELEEQKAEAEAKRVAAILFPPPPPTAWLVVDSKRAVAPPGQSRLEDVVLQDVTGVKRTARINELPNGLFLLEKGQPPTEIFRHRDEGKVYVWIDHAAMKAKHEYVKRRPSESEAAATANLAAAQGVLPKRQQRKRMREAEEAAREAKGLSKKRGKNEVPDDAIDAAAAAASVDIPTGPEYDEDGFFKIPVDAAVLTGADESVDVKTAVAATPAAAAPPPNLIQAKLYSVCREYSRTGSCKYGKSCKNSHDTAGLEPLSTVGRPTDGGGGGSATAAACAPLSAEEQAAAKKRAYIEEHAHVPRGYCYSFYDYGKCAKHDAGQCNRTHLRPDDLPVKSKGVCYAFSKNGRCPRGDHCGYTHKATEYVPVVIESTALERGFDKAVSTALRRRFA